MKVVFQVFSLSECISGFDNDGVHFDETDFTLSRDCKGSFDNINVAAKFIEETLKDYKRRKVKGVRFVIIPVYCNEGDHIFDHSPDDLTR